MKTKGVFKKFSKEINGGLVTKTLVVTELKTCYKGEVWDSSFKGWMGKDYKPIMSAKFYEKDGDMDLYRVCEYFGFKISDKLK